MTQKTDLQNIANAAINSNITEVRRLLSTGINNRQAYLYVEVFHQDYQASELIQKEGKCKCGGIASKWIPEPICSNCSFSKSMGHIEYG